MNRILNFYVAILFLFAVFVNFVDAKESDVVCDWIFSKNNSKGSIENKNLLIKDLSGNGNYLVMKTYKDGKLDKKERVILGKYINFSNNNLEQRGSMRFNGGTNSGVDFVTVDGAPIEKENFENRYTIEILYYLPKGWKKTDAFMGLLSREKILQKSNEIKENLSIEISDCKGFKFFSNNKKYENKSDFHYSLTMDKGDAWYHFFLVHDKFGTRSYLNGTKSFRDFCENESEICFNDEAGRFHVGSSLYRENGKNIRKFLKGNIERIRITRSPLEKSQWMIKNKERLGGDFGRNEDFKLKSRDNYNFVFLPDTQNTLKFRKDVLLKAVEKMIEDRDNLNLKAVVGLGDIVEDYDSKEQFEDAKDIFYRLPKSGIPTLMTPGNHDTKSDGITIKDIYYKKYFGEGSDISKLSQKKIFYSPSGRSSYMKVRAGSYEYMFVSLSWFDFSLNKDERNWLQKILLENKENPTVVSCHNIVTTGNDFSKVEISKGTGTNNIGMEIFNIIKKHNQVFMTVSGHF